MLASDLLKLATALKNGTLSLADFDKLATLPLGAGAPFYRISPAINFAAALNTVQTVVPSTPGYLFKGVSINAVLATASGVLTGNPSMSWGNDGANTNQGASLSLGATFPAGFANKPAFCGSLAVNNGSATMLDMTTPLACKITVAATGTSLVASGFFLVTGQVWPV